MLKMLLGAGLLIAALGLALCAYSVLTKTSQQITHGSQDNGAPQTHQNNADTGTVSDGADKDASGGDKPPNAKKHPVGPIWQWLNDREGAVTALSTALLMIFTFALVAATIGLYLTGEKAADAAKNAANAAIESNKISRAAMIADQRPWISLHVELAGPLSYTDKGWDAGLRWNLPLKYSLKQMGKTPATKVSVFGSLIPYTLMHFTEFKDGKPFGLPAPGTDFAKEIEAVCSFQEGMDGSGMGWGKVMFPTEEDGGLFGMNGNPRLFDAAKGENTGYSGQFVVVLCVTYGSTLDASRYRTAKVFQVYKDAGRIDLNGEVIAQRDLGFTPPPLSSGSTAR